MRIYSTLSNRKEDFAPIEEGKVKMYVCGPTVYDHGHLGHGRSAVAFDVIRRYLLYKGNVVTYVSNYTDIDDKMINRAAEEGITVEQLADKIIPEYAADYGALNVMKPDIQPKATEYVEEMVELISRLEKGGYIYVIDGDGVYYDITKFEAYGKLSGQNLDDLQMGARVGVKEEKRNPQDFVLWKFKKEGEPFWPSPWGDGRPGWHIECSAMTWKCLGEKFDIHGGGLDLTFPHHECEIAQSEGCFGSGSFAKYWLHNGFINVDNEKMSKSLGNFFTLKSIFEKYDPSIVRFMFLQTHYRNPVNFSDVLLDQAKAGLQRLHDFVRKMERAEGKDLSSDQASSEIAHLLKVAREGFESSMDEDFDTSGALGAIFDLVKGVNVLFDQDKIMSVDAEAVLSLLKIFDQVFAVIFVVQEEIDDEVQTLIKAREEARANKDFAESDRIRNELLKKGIVVEDTASGTSWKRV